ncbi:MAG: lipoyl(octanoyl) transferase LipB [Pseudomonadota bacterium]
MGTKLKWSFLGRVEYPRALEIQKRLRDEIHQGVRTDTLLLLEHPPVITMGRSARVENVLVSEEDRRRCGVDFVRVQRGGDVTYHGPGQLVGYPIRRVGKSVRLHVAGMGEAIVQLLAGYGIESWWREDIPGVWTAEGKIAAVGVEVRDRISIHGFAMNVSTRLSDFGMIVPCGLCAQITSMQALIGEVLCLDELAGELAPLLARQYGSECEKISAQDVTRIQL